MKRKIGDASSHGLQVIHESVCVPAFSTSLTRSPFSMEASHMQAGRGDYACHSRVLILAKPDDVQERDNLGTCRLHQGFVDEGRVSVQCRHTP